METLPEDLTGMDVPEAKEYIAQHLISLKLTEKAREEAAAEAAKWTERALLARKNAREDLAAAAEAQAAAAQERFTALQAEAAALKSAIARMKAALPALQAAQRSIDPFLLEQELLIARGFLPGDEKKAELEARFSEEERQYAADTELAALKAKLGKQAPPLSEES